MDYIIAGMALTVPALDPGKSHLLLVPSVVLSEWLSTLDNFNLRFPIGWGVQSGE